MKQRTKFLLEWEHRPHTLPTKVDDLVEDVVVRARKEHPRRSTPFTQPFAEVVAPNTAWCVDLTG